MKMTSRILGKIEEVHGGFRLSPCRTLREDFLMGKWTNEKKKRILMDEGLSSRMKEYMRQGKTGAFKQFEVYARIECGYIHKRSLLVPMIDIKSPKLLDAPNPKNSDLTELAITCRDYPSTLMPIKAAVLRLELEKEYTGLQPVTSPVRKGMHILLGEIQTVWDHMILCNTWALEMGTTPTHINTYFWMIGMGK